MSLDHEMHTAKIYINNAHAEIIESPKTQAQFPSDHLMERGKGRGGSGAAR